MTTSVPTPAMPMPGGHEQLELLQVLEQSDSMYRLIIELPALADKLQVDPLVLANHGGVKRTVYDLGHDGRTWTMARLLYSMHPSSIKSIVKNTVAHDAVVGGVTWVSPTVLTSTTVGGYVLGLRLEADPQGGFLTPSEIQRIVTGINRYLLGDSADGSPAPQHQTPDVLAAVLYRRRVDEAYDLSGSGRKILNKPTGKARDGAYRLRDNLTRAGTLSVSLDRPGADTRQLQSPLYTGCSHSLVEELEGYKKTTGYQRANAVLMLLLSVAKVEKLELAVQARIVLCTWEPDQLEVAGRLITTLSRSLLWQCGLNLDEGGGTKDTALGDFTGARNFVFSQPHFTSNLIQAQLELQKRASFVQRVEQLHIDVLAEEAAVAKDSKSHPVEPSLPFAVVKARQDEKIARLKSELEAVEQKIRLEEVYIRLNAAAWPSRMARIRDALPPDEQADLDRVLRGPIAVQDSQSSLGSATLPSCRDLEDSLES